MELAQARHNNENLVFLKMELNQFKPFYFTFYADVTHVPNSPCVLNKHTIFSLLRLVMRLVMLFYSSPLLNTLFIINIMLIIVQYCSYSLIVTRTAEM